MPINFQHKAPKTVFRRWSRNGYAVFSAIRKEVAIGHLCYDIANCAVQKNANGINPVVCSFLLPNQFPISFDDDDEPPVIE